MGGTLAIFDDGAVMSVAVEADADTRERMERALVFASISAGLRITTESEQSHQPPIEVHHD